MRRADRGGTARLTVVASASMGHEKRDRRTREHALGGSSQDKFPDAGVPVCTHDQKIGISIRHMSFKYLTDPATFCVDFVEDHLDTVSG